MGLESGVAPDGAGEAHAMMVRVMLALRCSRDLDAILDDHLEHVRLPEPVAADLLDKTLLFCQLTSELTDVRGHRLFNVTQKFHILIHCAMRAADMNPRLGWCWLGEDYMCRMRMLIGSCTRGVKPEDVGKKIVRK